MSRGVLIVDNFPHDDEVAGKGIGCVAAGKTVSGESCVELLLNAAIGKLLLHERLDLWIFGVNG